MQAWPSSCCAGQHRPTWLGVGAPPPLHLSTQQQQQQQLPPGASSRLASSSRQQQLLWQALPFRRQQEQQQEQQQRRAAANVRCRAYSAGRPGPSPGSDDEYEFSLKQYMVTLDKPIGVTLAPDPLSGQVFVQEVQPGLSADLSRMVMVGDRLLLVSAASTLLGDDMWPATDLQRTRWAINNRVGQVRLVFERSTAALDGQPSEQQLLPPPWYFAGREGVASWQAPELQLPIRFDTSVGGELSDSAPGVGRSLSVSFNRCLAPPSPEQARRLLRPGLLARRARAEQLLAQLTAAAAAPDVDYASPFLKQLAAIDAARFQVGLPGMQPMQAPGSQNVLPFRRPASTSSNTSSSSSNNSGGSSGGSAAGAPPPAAAAAPQADAGSGAAAAAESPPASGPGNGSATTPPQQQQQQPPLPPLIPPPGTAWIPPDSVAYRQPRVVAVLPWLLVSDGRLAPVDLGQLATSRALSCLLELQLSVGADDGLLRAGGRPPPPFSLPPEPPPTTLAPSESPVPAPQRPPPLQAAADGEAAADEGSSSSSGNEDADAVVASMAGLAGPDLGFASAAVAAAAAAAAVERESSSNASSNASSTATSASASAAEEDGDSEGSGDSSSSSSNAAGAVQPSSSSDDGADAASGQALLQAHAVLHVLSDLQRLVARRRWRRNAGVSRYSYTSKFGSWSSPPGSGVYSSRAAAASRRAGGSRGGVSGGSGAGGGAAGSSGGGVWGSSSSSSSSGRSGSTGSSSSGGRGSVDAAGGGGGEDGLQGGGGGDDWAAGGMGVASRQILLQCEGGRGTWALVGVLLSVWLHWCGGVDLQAAAEGVGRVLGVTVDQAVLAEVRRLLLVRAKQRFGRRMLTWPYGGASAEVSGELVGGWTRRVPMTRCTSPDGCLGASNGHFFLELAGLAPGRYHYKFIVDDTWAVDGLAPKTLDSQGNWNNVLEVSAPPRIETPEEQGRFGALQAAWCAFERKGHFLQFSGGGGVVGGGGGGMAAASR